MLFYFMNLHNELHQFYVIVTSISNHNWKSWMVSCSHELLEQSEKGDISINRYIEIFPHIATKLLHIKKKCPSDHKSAWAKLSHFLCVSQLDYGKIVEGELLTHMGDYSRCTPGAAWKLCKLFCIELKLKLNSFRTTVSFVSSASFKNRCLS